MTIETPGDRRQGVEAGVRTMLIVGPIATCIGIAWTAIAPSTMSNAAVLIGFATCVYGTHRYGRLGADEPPAKPQTKSQSQSTTDDP